MPYILWLDCLMDPYGLLCVFCLIREVWLSSNVLVSGKLKQWFCTQASSTAECLKISSSGSFHLPPLEISRWSWKLNDFLLFSKLFQVDNLNPFFCVYVYLHIHAHKQTPLYMSIHWNFLSNSYYKGTKSTLFQEFSVPSAAGVWWMPNNGDH